MELTRDTVCRGLLHVDQPRRGYRFNLDSVLLGAFAAAHAPPGLVVDAGAGCGVVGLYVAAVTGFPALLVERQAEMANLAAQNAARNGGGRAVRGDFRMLPVANGSVATLVCNPPYLRAGSGRPSPRTQRLLSSQALHGGIEDVMAEAARVLAPGGVFACVLPATLADGLQGVALRRHRSVGLCPAAGRPPSRVLLAWNRGRGPATYEERVVHEGSRFAPWLDDILEGRRRHLA